MKNGNLIFKAFVIAGLIGLSALGTVGCGKEETLTKAEIQQLQEAKEKDKQAMAEKKILSDFQNKAYKIYKLDQIGSLPEVLDRDIKKLSQENAVKMLMNYELSQRMALQNDTYYGAVSKELAALIGVDTPNGLVALKALTLQTETLKAEVQQILEGKFQVYKDETGIYRIVDYSALQTYKPYVNDECARYIDYMASESNMPSIRNKRFAVDREEAWRRLVYLDTYFTDYPVPSDDLIRNNLGRYYQDLMKHILYGDDLKPNFDPITGLMSPEATQFLATHKFNPNSKLYLPYENYKTQLATDKGILSPAVSTQIQQLLRLVNELVTDHIN